MCGLLPHVILIMFAFGCVDFFMFAIGCVGFGFGLGCALLAFPLGTGSVFSLGSSCGTGFGAGAFGGEFDADAPPSWNSTGFLGFFPVSY